MIKGTREFGERKYISIDAGNIEDRLYEYWSQDRKRPFRKLLLLTEENNVSVEHPAISLEGTVYSGHAEYETDLVIALGKEDGLKFIKNLREFCDMAEEYLNKFE